MKTRLTLALLLSLTLPARAAGERPYLEAALGAERWLRSVAVTLPDGLAWPVDPDGGKEFAEHLYSGSPGVVLFYLELARATGDPSYLEPARRSADRFLAEIPAGLDPGAASLYVGYGGLAFALNEAAKATGEERYRAGAKRIVDWIKRSAKPVGKGVEWSSVTDIIGGSAGIGLTLLDAADEFGDREALRIATLAGQRLIELARPENVGLSWETEPGFARVMPNFSHGTAGVAYFLASLYLATEDRAFLEAALAGGQHLRAIARCEGGTCLIRHHQGDGEDLFYLSYCHGPAGTGRLFMRLYQATGDRRWLAWLDKSAEGITASGIPEGRTSGFWNNVGQCCGSAGVGEFLMNLDRFRGEKRHRPFVERLAKDLLTRATPANGGLKWVQAEHRVQPDLLLAQTGFMQGAAGIGLFFLHLDAFDRGEKRLIRLPDDPF